MMPPIYRIISISGVLFALEEMSQYKRETVKGNTRKENALVTLDYVTFGYDEHVVLDDVSFQVEEGE